MIGLLLFVVLFVWGFVQFGRKCGGTPANRRYRGAEWAKDWPNGTLIQIKNPSNPSVLREELWYYGVRRPIEQSLTKKRLTYGVRPTFELKDGKYPSVTRWPPLTIGVDSPDNAALNSLPLGPVLELDGWAVTIPGVDGIYYLYHSRFHRIAGPEDLRITGLQGQEVRIEPYEARGVPYEPGTINAGDMTNIFLAYKGGWERLKGGPLEYAGKKQDLDTVVFWCTLSRRTDRWRDIDSNLSHLD